MTTPISVLFILDVSEKTCAHNAKILSIVDKTFDSLRINDDVASVIVSHDMINVCPFKTVRLLQSHKAEIEHEIATSNTVVYPNGAIANKSYKSSNLSRALAYGETLMNQKLEKHASSAWMPNYVLVFTDGRPDKEYRDAIIDQVHNCFNAAVDFVIVNHHRPTRRLADKLNTEFPGSAVLRAQSDISIMKIVWAITERIRKQRNSVNLKDLPNSIARRKAPGHVRVPSIFQNAIAAQQPKK